jgi:hypothetical protein
VVRLPSASPISQLLYTVERPNYLCPPLSTVSQDVLRPLRDGLLPSKAPEEKVQRALQQSLEGLYLEAVARVEDVHPTTIQHGLERACLQVKAADREVVTGISAENLEQVVPHWTHVAIGRELRLLLEVVVGPLTQASTTAFVEGAAKRLAPNRWPLWSSDGSRILLGSADHPPHRPDLLYQGHGTLTPKTTTGCA